ncbi:MAG TPA: DUF58 domain-containing protein [Herpetosiphonaceae bacterium]|nr:DUF58 domain-containing protein [Herpetosiphonaceae bacterium]
MLPTPRLLLLLLLGAVVVAGTSFARPLAWLAVAYFLVLFGLIVADLLITTRPGQIVAERLTDPKLSLGADNLVRILLINRSPRPLAFELRDEYPFEFRAEQTALRGILAPLATAETRYHVRPLTRGDYRWGGLNLRYASRLGTFRRQARYHLDADVRVYPNVLDVRKYDLLARQGLLMELGLRVARVGGAGTEFERLRDYTPDDEYRRINWKATARRNRPIAVEYQTERSQHVVYVLDTGRLMRPPIAELAKLDYAINAALLASYVATLRGDRVGLLTFADEVGVYLAPDKGRGQFYSMLELLYNVRSEPVEADYARALGYLGIKNKRRSLIVIFTDLVTLDAAQPLIAYTARLALRHLPLVVTMHDPHIAALTRAPATSAAAVYERAVAEQLVDERRVILDTLNRAGVLTLDVEADKLSAAVINKYLELKSRGSL